LTINLGLQRDEWLESLRLLVGDEAWVGPAHYSKGRMIRQCEVAGQRVRKRGGPPQYKDYVLVLLFIKYISDKYAGQPFAPITIPR
jgi:hypothetical protein